MNKPIQIKRNKPASSHYRVLYAKTGRKRRLHAATTATADQHAGMGADAPSIGVGRALFVILILHVLAVAAIYIHSALFLLMPMRLPQTKASVLYRSLQRR